VRRDEINVSNVWGKSKQRTSEIALQRRIQSRNGKLKSRGRGAIFGHFRPTWSDGTVRIPRKSRLAMGHLSFSFASQFSIYSKTSLWCCERQFYKLPADADWSGSIFGLNCSNAARELSTNYPPPASLPPSSSSPSSLSPGLICACRRVVLPVCFCLCLYVSACCTRSAYASRLRALCSPLHVPPRKKKKKKKKKREKPCRAGSTTDERRQRVRGPDGLHAEGRSRRR